MGDSLEDKVMGKKLLISIKDLKWVITSAIFCIGLIITVIMWINDRKKVDSLGTKVSELTKENSILKNQVSTLEGKVEGVSTASKIFMENSPSENRYRIELVEKRINRLELPGSNPPLPIPELTIVNDTIRRDH